MTKNIKNAPRQRGIEPYWYVIGALLLTLFGVFLNHLRTGVTPDRVFINIPGVDFDVFWYGILIVGGIALGSYVVSHLVEQRGAAVLYQRVPRNIRQKSVNKLPLPDDIKKILTKHKIKTVGQLLLRWGFDPRSLGLNKEGVAKVESILKKTPGVEKAWLTDAPWRVWNPDHVWNGIAICLVLAVIGARLYHVLTPSPSMAAVGINSPLDYFRNPYQLINLRNGGLGIYGGIAGGALGLWWFTRRYRLPTLVWADYAAIGVALGQVFGRWGNFFNQELYGRPSDLTWAITIDPVYRLPAYADVTRFHPAFLYESLWSLLAFAVLYLLLRRCADRLLTGDLMALYLIFYAVGRILLETVRLDSRMVNLGGLTLNMAVATFVSILVALAMAGWRVWAHWRVKD